MAPQYKLTHFNLKGLVEPIRILFHYAGVEFEDERMELADDWQTSKPKMPCNTPAVLEVDGKQLSTSTAILLYLGRKFNLAGADDFETAKCSEYVDVMNDLHIECKVLFVEQDEAKKGELKAKLQKETLPSSLKKFEEILEKNGNGVLVGSSVTYADIFAAHFLSLLCEWIEVQLESFPVCLLIARKYLIFLESKSGSLNDPLLRFNYFEFDSFNIESCLM